MAIPNFIDYFQNQVQFRDEYLGKLTIDCREVGAVFVPSGKIVACDPFVFPETSAFKTQVKPGHYPVILSILRSHENGDERVAFAMLRFSHGNPKRWEVAVTPEQDLTQLKEDEYFGYPVDAGVGCFMSEEAACTLVQKMAEKDDYYEDIMAAMQQNYVPTRDWIDWNLEDINGLNVVVFSSGFGDGSYGSYWGYDDVGKIVCLVTDFGAIG
jgi:hypothetical protein